MTNGLSWQVAACSGGFLDWAFDPQIMVDPVDRQTVYASWLQNNKRDVMVARSQDFGRSWYLAIAQTLAGRRGQACAAVARRGCLRWIQSRAARRGGRIA